MSPNPNPNLGEFLHYVFESMHDDEYDGAVRILVSLSCMQWGFFNYIN